MAESDDSIEVWKPVLGFEGLYEVSSYGRVKRTGAGRGAQAGRIKALTLSSTCPYLLVSLWKNNEESRMCVHTIVLEAFTGPRPEDKEGNHKDLNKTNNHLSNLEWMTHLENVRHAVRNGHKGGKVGGNAEGLRRWKADNPGYSQGAKNSMSKLDDTKVVRILKMLAQGKTPREISPLFSVSRSTIHYIRTGHTWKHIPR